MDISSNEHNSTIEKKFSGKFTFSDNNTIKTMLQEFEEDKFDTIQIDLSNVEFVDSAALGMFLLIKEEAEKANSELIIKNPQGQVKKMFELSRFYDLFQIQ